MKKTIFVSQKQEATGDVGILYHCPMVYYDRQYRKWMEDRVYFPDETEFVAEMKRNGFAVK